MSETTIGYLVPEFPGQTHIFLWRECQALRDLGVDVHLLSTRRPPARIMSHDWSADAAGMTHYLFPLGRPGPVFRTLLTASPLRWGRCLAAILKAKGTLRDRARLAACLPFGAKLAAVAHAEGWRHVHVASCGNTANIAMFANLLADIDYSLALLGPRLTTYGPNQDLKWKTAAFGLFQSQALYDEARAVIPDSLPARVDVAPVGVNLDVMKRQAPYVPWDGCGPCQIYCCGRLNQIKGHTYLIEAVKVLRGMGVDAKLVIGGEDEQGGEGYRKVIEAFIEQEGMADHVTLLGAVSETRNCQGYGEAHIYAMGSLDEAAGAVAAMEAMAMETPVVMTNVGATPELIEDGVDALLVPSKDPRAQAEAMHRILRDPALALQLGRAGREKIARKFSHRRSAETIRTFLMT